MMHRSALAAALDRRHTILSSAVAVTAAAGLLAGCSLLPSRTSGSATNNSAPFPADGVTGTVIRVTDGDTVTLQTPTGGHLKVRLLSIDAPEIAHGSTPADCGGPQAKTALHDLVQDRTVHLTTDPRTDEIDRYGRVLGYLDLDGRDIALELIRDGHASAWRPKNTPRPTRWALYQQASNRAASERRGSWATCTRLGRAQT